MCCVRGGEEMKTCRDCFHYTPCWKASSIAVKQHAEQHEIVQYCLDFCERTRVALLAVGIGETVYLLERGEVVEAHVIEASADITQKNSGRCDAAYVAESDAGHRFFGDEDLGDAVFLTREAAEMALSLRESREEA